MNIPRWPLIQKIHGEYDCCAIKMNVIDDQNDRCDFPKLSYFFQNNCLTNFQQFSILRVESDPK